MVQPVVPPHERRRDRRLCVTAQVRVTQATSGAVIEGELRDVSAGGLRMGAPADIVLVPGAEVEVALRLAGFGQPGHQGFVDLRGRGQVLRIVPAEQGGVVDTAVRFTSPLDMREPFAAALMV